LIIKTTFKSHFKIKTAGKLKKKILTKNVILFIILSKFFLKDFCINMFFKKCRKNVINVLKAPCRHKKFFHKLTYEYYIVNIVYRYKKEYTLYKKIKMSGFLKRFSRVYNRFGTTSLCRTKLLIIVPSVLVNFFKCV
jgi:hypothetical protein